MRLKERIVGFFKKYIFSTKWRCLSCGKEIFSESDFCDKCYKELPFNNGYICDHCGRKVIAAEKYCSTCKGRLVAVDKARSVFSYEKPISDMIKRLKYSNQRFLVEYFSRQLSNVYLQNYFNADFITFVPMTAKSQRKRGYNQSYLLAKALSERVSVPLYEGVIKIKETKRQATLNREQRKKNLEQAFKITDRKGIKGKTLVIIDDVTTTGSTAEAVAERMKNAGAKTVYLITVASLPPSDKY